MFNTFNMKKDINLLLKKLKLKIKIKKKKGKKE